MSQRVNKKHKYSTYLLCIMLTIIGIFTLVSALQSDDLDEICAIDGSTLKRINGQWQCNMPHWAEGSYHSYATPLTVSIGTADTYYNITGFNLTAQGIIPNGNSIQITKNATYQIVLQLSFYGGNSGIYELELFVNDIAKPNCAFFRTTNTIAIGNAAAPCIETLTAGDMLVVKIKDINPPAQDANIHQLGFIIHEI